MRFTREDDDDDDVENEDDDDVDDDEEDDAVDDDVDEEAVCGSESEITSMYSSSAICASTLSSAKSGTSSTNNSVTFRTGSWAFLWPFSSSQLCAPKESTTFVILFSFLLPSSVSSFFSFPLASSFIDDRVSPSELLLSSSSVCFLNLSSSLFFAPSSFPSLLASFLLLSPVSSPSLPPLLPSLLPSFFLFLLLISSASNIFRKSSTKSGRNLAKSVNAFTDGGIIC